jgi:hypothetical protein
MAADATQRPGEALVGFRRGDEYRKTITANIDLTGYALTWEIYGLRDDQVKLSGSLSLVTAPYSVSLILSEIETGSLLPGTYGFRAIWVAPGSIRRTFLDSICEVTR